MKIAFIILMVIVFGCTINFQNTSSNGKADDLIDTEQSTDVSPDVEIPLIK